MATNAELQAKVKELEEQLEKAQKSRQGSCAKLSLTEDDESIRNSSTDCKQENKIV